MQSGLVLAMALLSRGCSFLTRTALLENELDPSRQTNTQNLHVKATIPTRGTINYPGLVRATLVGVYGFNFLRPVQSRQQKYSMIQIKCPFKSRET